ncbi:GL25309 [Drosophila persimilis]|uniref:GL25309 n=1 Tax=Drosophila persimilis TaxID=7234 RepID=B4GU39_DROPE|nr:GL25309 [Drosophila persimilis]
MPKARRVLVSGTQEPQRARRSTPMSQTTEEPVVVAPGTVNKQELAVFEVEMIIDQRRRGGRTEFLLKWKHYSEEFNSWEPRSHLMCPKLEEEEDEDVGVPVPVPVPLPVPVRVNVPLGVENELGNRANRLQPEDWDYMFSFVYVALIVHNVLCTEKFYEIIFSWLGPAEYQYLRF